MIVLCGTGVGEACPPLGLGIAAGGVLALGYDQVFSSTSQARNAELLAIAGSLGCHDNGSMAKKFSWVHDVMGPDLFHGSYAIATDGLGVKPGRAIGVELNASISMRKRAWQTANS